MTRSQHVAALRADDPLPPTQGLPDGYAVIKDGKTWVIRLGRWVKGIADPGPLSPSPPVPDPPQPAIPPPSIIGAPSEDELAAYLRGWGSVSLNSTTGTPKPKGGQTLYLPCDVSVGEIPNAIGRDGALLMRRPGYYRVELDHVQGVVPTGVRFHLRVYPWWGPSAYLHHDPGQRSAFGAGVIFCGTADEDVDLGNGGGGVFAMLAAEANDGSNVPAGPYVARMRMIPIVFTGELAMPPGPQLQIQGVAMEISAINRHAIAQFSVTGGGVSSARVQNLVSENAQGQDVWPVHSWFPASLNSGTWMADLGPVPDGITTTNTTLSVNAEAIGDNGYTVSKVTQWGFIGSGS